MPPRRRNTKINTRAKPKAPEGDQGNSLTEQERKRKLDVFVQDYDIKVQENLKKMETQKNQIIKSVTVKFQRELLQLPQEVREMTLDDFIMAGGTAQSALEYLEMRHEEDRPMVACPMSSKLVRTLSQKRPNFLSETILEEQSSASPAPRQNRKKKPARRSTVKKNPLQDSVYRPLMNSAAKNRFRTPAHRTMTDIGFDTPLITPKFDPKLPYTPAGVRDPKPGERLLSVTGSPVSNPADPSVIPSDPRVKLRNNRLSLHIGNIEDIANLDVDIPEDHIHQVLKVFTTIMKKAKQ